jgi:hypothetical protein
MPLSRDFLLGGWGGFIWQIHMKSRDGVFDLIDGMRTYELVWMRIGKSN